MSESNVDIKYELIPYDGFMGSQTLQRYLPSADAEHHSSHLQAYLLQQYGEVGHESKDVPIPDGAFGHRCNAEYLHASWFGGCCG